MLTITFHNDGTGTKEVGNYDVTVSVNGLVVERTRVERHERRLCWRALVARLLVPGAIVEDPDDAVLVGKPCDNLKGEQVQCTT